MSIAEEIGQKEETPFFKGVGTLARQYIMPVLEPVWLSFLCAASSIYFLSNIIFHRRDVDFLKLRCVRKHVSVAAVCVVYPE